MDSAVEEHLSPVEELRKKGRRKIPKKLASVSKTTLEGRGRAVLISLLVLVVGLAITAATTTNTRRSASQEARRQFDSSSEQTAIAVQRSLQSHMDKLRDIGAFVANSADTSGEQYRDYVESSQVFEQFPSMGSLFYLRRVEPADLETAVASEKEKNPGFGLFMLGEHEPGRPYLLLTRYQAGQVDLNLPLGTDTSTIPSVWSLIDYSAETGDAVVGSFGSDPVIAKIAKDTHFPLIDALVSIDFFIGVPIYGPAPADGGGPGIPVGWQAATIDKFSEVVKVATEGQPDTLGLSLKVDLTAAGLETEDAIARVAAQEGSAGPKENSAFDTTKTFKTDGVEWTIDLWSKPDADAEPISVRLILIAGIVGSVLAASFVYARAMDRQRERRSAAEARDRAQFQRDILDSVTNPMVVLDGTGHILDTNPAWNVLREASGTQGTEPDMDPLDIGSDYLTVLESGIRSGGENLVKVLTDVLNGRAEEAEADIALGNGSRHHWYSARATRLRGSSGGAVVMHTDVTELKRSHDELEMKASRDNLTGLLNRAAFEKEVDAALLHARAHDEGLAVLFIDLDGFKPINDTYGHAVGDDVLRAVVQRITSAVRTSDRVARLGGDEFVVLIAPLKDLDIAERTADRILEVLTQPVRVGGRAIPLSASIGISSIDTPLGDDHKQLIERADHAMYMAKQQGGARTALS